MQKEHYLGYIAHFVKTVDNATVDNYRAFFIEHLGTANVMNAPDAKVKDVARWMYRAHVASLYVRYGPFYLLTQLSSNDIEKMMKEVIDVVDNFGLYKSIDEDLSVANVDKHVKKYAVDTYKSILSKYILVPSAKTKTTTKTAAKPATKPKSAPKTAAKASAKASAKPVAKQAARPAAKTSKKSVVSRPVPASKKTVAKKKPSPKRPGPSTAKKCEDHLVSVLKDMARNKGIKGFSKMKKPELCAALGIKG